MTFSTYDLKVLHQGTAEESRSRSFQMTVTADGLAIALAVLAGIITLVIMALTYV